jgi:hypothetical protein
MIYMGLTGINYYTLAVEKDRDSTFTTIWKPGFNTKRVSTRNFHSKFQSIIPSKCVFSQQSVLHKPKYR